MSHIYLFSLFIMFGSSFGCARKSGAANYTPKTSAELEKALSTVKPGEIIELLPEEYKGDFVLPDNDNGLHTTSPPATTLRGSNSPDGRKHTTIIGSGSGTTLDVKGSTSFWCVQDMSVKGGAVGVAVSGNKNVIKSLSMEGMDTAVKVEGNENMLDSLSIKDGKQGVIITGSKNIVKSLSISDQSSLGLSIISGDGNEIDSVSFKSTGPTSILLSEASSGSVLKSVSLQDTDGIFEVKGNGNQISSISSRGGVDVQGCDNVIDNSSLNKLYLSDKCQNTLGSSNSVKNKVKSPLA